MDGRPGPALAQGKSRGTSGDQPNAQPGTFFFSFLPVAFRLVFFRLFFTCWLPLPNLEVIGWMMLSLTLSLLHVSFKILIMLKISGRDSAEKKSTPNGPTHSNNVPHLLLPTLWTLKMSGFSMNIS